MKFKSIFLLIILVLISCKKEEKDDSYKYLYDKLDESIIREKNTLESVYYKFYEEIKKDSSERKRYDSLYKISLNIDNKLKKLDFSDHKKVIKFRDSTAKALGTPLRFFNQDDNKKLNDSVFKMMIEIEILRLRETFNGIRIHRFTGLKVQEEFEKQ